MARSVPTGQTRKLWTADETAFREHLLRLDAETRRKRFAMATTDEFIARYAANIFNFHSVVHGHFVEGTLRGVGELRLMDVSGREAEAAFSVEDGWQGQGIGTDLMHHTLTTARNRGIARVYMNCLASNRSMQRLARSQGAELEYEAGDVVGLLLPPAASPTSIAREIAWDTAGWATAVVDMQRRFLSHRLARN